MPSIINICRHGDPTEVLELLDGDRTPSEDEYRMAILNLLTIVRSLDNALDRLDARVRELEG